MMETLLEGAERFAVLDYVPIGIAVLDGEMRVVFWNSCLEDWTGISRDRILGNDVRSHFPHLDQPRYRARLADVISGGAPTIFSSQLHPHLLKSTLRGGRLRTQHTVAVAVPGAEAGTRYALLAVQDVTSLAETMEAVRLARDEAQHQAATDSLTGISNRRHFVDAAERSIAQSVRYGRPAALLVIDLDGFKAINDTNGHLVGDALLREIVRVCRRSLRDADLLGRLGGDEFAALLPETTGAMGFVTAERLRTAVAAGNFQPEGRKVDLSVSIGVAALSREARTFDAVLRLADAALYEAKRKGRNRTAAAGFDPA
jgi:diguanylate cyclase (GGDEF)-like protein/PAS domain S-box-containing protein